MLREEAGSRRRWVSRVSVPAEEPAWVLWKGEPQGHWEQGSGQPGGHGGQVSAGARSLGLLQFLAVRWGGLS